MALPLKVLSCCDRRSVACHMSATRKITITLEHCLNRLVVHLGQSLPRTFSCTHIYSMICCRSCRDDVLAAVLVGVHFLIFISLRYSFLGRFIMRILSVTF